MDEKKQAARLPGLQEKFNETQGGMYEASDEFKEMLRAVAFTVAFIQAKGLEDELTEQMRAFGIDKCLTL